MLKKILIALLAVGMIFAAACKPQVDNPIDDPDVEQDDQMDDADENVDPTDPYAAENLKAFIEEKYAKAKEACFWFEVSSMPPAENHADMNNIKEIDGQYYYKTGTENINSVAELEAYLKTLFSDEIVEKLMTMNGIQYIDIDGELWGVDASRGTNINVGNTIFSIREKTDDKIVYTANVEIINPENGETESVEAYDYVYEKTDDGWKWTKFTIYE